MLLARRTLISTCNYLLVPFKSSSYPILSPSRYISMVQHRLPKSVIPTMYVPPAYMLSLFLAMLPSSTSLCNLPKI